MNGEDPGDIDSRIGTLSAAKRALLGRRLLRPDDDRGGGGPVRGSSRTELLSFNQRRQWFLERLAPDGATYNVGVARRVTGPLDKPALKAALQAVVDRHETLRTRFFERDGEPRQRVEPVVAVDLEEIDFSRFSDGEWEDQVRRLASDRTASPLDLERGPPFRFTLFRRAATDHVLLRVMNHIVTDGWSEGVFERDLGEAYSAAVAGRDPGWPDLAVRYTDFVAWQRDRLSPDSAAAQLAYWRRQLAGAPPTLDMVADFARPAAPVGPGTGIKGHIPARVVARLIHLAEGAAVTPFMVALAVYARLLNLYSRQSDIVIGIPIAGRNAAGLEDLVGFFANSLPLRIEVDGATTFRDLLAGVARVSLDAYSNQDLPFETLVEELGPERMVDATPVFQTMLAFQNVPRTPPQFSGLQITDFELDSRTAAFKLTLTVRPQQDRTWRWSINYRSDVFAAPVVEELSRCFCVLLESAVSEPDIPLSRLSLVSAADRERAVRTWNDTATDFPRGETVSRLFEMQARAQPGAPAISLGNETLSYGELNARANRLARRLQSLGVTRESVVAVVASRSIGTVVCLLAVLKSGGGYLPVDPEEPEPRLAFMLADANARILIVPGNVARGFTPGGVEIVTMEEGRAQSAGEDDLDLDVGGDAGDLAYVIYTSGSTGEPKGVAVEHRAITRLVRGTSFAEFGPDRVFLQVAPVSFDASTFEIWGPLLNGGRCVIYPEPVPTPAGLRNLIGDAGVNTIFLTSGLFNIVIDQDPEALTGITELFTGGEAMSVPHVAAALTSLPHTRVVNCYGPTEGTTFTTTFDLKEKEPEIGRSVPIGRPIANTTTYVLDDGMNVCPVGMPGELYIGGSGVARGYVNDPQLTAERFLPDPFSTDAGARLYRTGDVCRYAEDGLIEFLGRTDNQVKIRGFRIEPGEIVAALNQCAGVRDSAVTVREHAQAGKSLVAYVVAEEDPVPAIDDLKRQLAGLLPGFMVPAAFVMLETLPLNRNGKVDFRLLPDPAELMRDPSGTGLPRTAIEVQLVAIWSRVLGVTDLGIDDDFFELGGNSLLALRLFAEMEKTLGEALPLATLFQAPTVRRLVEVWEKPQGRRRWSCIVPLQTRGNRPPFFCVHGLHGNVIAQRTLARRMGADQPYYAIQAVGLDGRTPPLRSVEAMAARYVAEIRKVRPRGPYVLGGHCFGGMVAFEMAHILTNEGDTVPLLVMLDSPVPLDREERRARRDFRLRRAIGELLHRAGLVHRWSPRDWIGSTNMRARDRYVPRPYGGPVLHITSTRFGPANQFSVERSVRWDRLSTGKHECRVVDAHHSLILSEPTVSQTAAAITERIDAFLENGGR